MYNYYLSLKREKEKEDKIKFEQSEQLFKAKHKSKYSFNIN